MTKGQMEAEISKIVVRFEKEYMGRGPKDIRTFIHNRHIMIVIDGFLSHSEKKLASESQGVKVIKEMRRALFESARRNLVDAIETVIGNQIVSTHSDVSTKTGEKIIVLTLENQMQMG